MRPMKPFLRRFGVYLLAVLLCLAATARADDDKPEKDPANVKKGMTMAQVKKEYGDPASVATDQEHGTLWTYTPNRAKGFIPFYGEYVKAHIVQVFFRNGRVYKVALP